MSHLVDLLHIPGFWIAVGLCVGSFLTVVVWRLPIILAARAAGRDPGMTLSLPHSRCSCCGRPLRLWHNVPVLGFLMLRGKTRCCGQTLHWRYLALEAGAGAWAAAAWWAFDGQPLRMVALSVFGWSAMALAWMTVASGITPRRVSLIAAISLCMAIF